MPEHNEYDSLFNDLGITEEEFNNCLDKMEKYDAIPITQAIQKLFIDPEFDEPVRLAVAFHMGYTTATFNLTGNRYIV